MLHLIGVTNSNQHRNKFKPKTKNRLIYEIHIAVTKVLNTYNKNEIESNENADNN